MIIMDFSKIFNLGEVQPKKPISTPVKKKEAPAGRRVRYFGMFRCCCGASWPPFMGPDGKWAEWSRTCATCARIAEHEKLG
jgi:hypothetical protein